MGYLIAGICFFLLWTFCGLALGAQWFMTDDPEAWQDAERDPKKLKEMQYFDKMSGKYVAFMGGPIVWCVLFATRKR